MADYFSQADLENAISPMHLKSAYNDDHSGTVNATGIAACIAYGGAQCDSWMRNFMMTSGGASIELPIATGVPNEVKFAAIDFGIAYTIRRRPDIFAALNLPAWTVYYDQAVEQMKRYTTSLQAMPATLGEHANAGATLVNPESDENGDEEGPPDEPRWADPADFV